MIRTVSYRSTAMGDKISISCMNFKRTFTQIRYIGQSTRKNTDSITDSLNVAIILPLLLQRVLNVLKLRSTFNIGQAFMLNLNT